MTVEQKATVKLSTTIDDKTYTFDMPLGSPFGGAYDACHAFLQEVTKMAKDAAERAKREEVTSDKDGKKEA